MVQVESSGCLAGEPLDSLRCSNGGRYCGGSWINIDGGVVARVRLWVESWQMLGGWISIAGMGFMTSTVLRW